MVFPTSEPAQSHLDTAHSFISCTAKGAANHGDNSGDKRADYIRIHHVDGSVDLWINQVGLNPANWIEQGPVATGVGFSGSSVKFGSLTNSGRADYVPVVLGSGAITPWLNGCKNPKPTPSGGEADEDNDRTKDPNNSSGQDVAEEAEGAREGGGDGGALTDNQNETTADGTNNDDADDVADSVPAYEGIGGGSNGAGGRQQFSNWTRTAFAATITMDS